MFAISTETQSFAHTARHFALRVGTALSLLTIAACSEADTTGPAVVAGAPNTAAAETAIAVSDAEAARFLVQATFGPTEQEIADVAARGYSDWVGRQLRANPSLHLTKLNSQLSSGGEVDQNAASSSFWETAVSADDQLRQRMAFALSQILVVSDGPGSGLSGEALPMAYYMDILTRGAFGNYRDLLEEVTYSSPMAIYLTYLRNQKANPDNGRVPDENYARELLQLFTIGLVELQPDGTPAPGDAETYTNADVEGLAQVFTGLSLKGGFWNGNPPEAKYSRLEVYPEHHSPEEKTFLGQTIPANTGAEASIDQALDIIFNHPNVAPFISRQLIQRFVTSNPSPAYVRRVAGAFEAGSYTLGNGNTVGEGRRGDLSATIAAILLDAEARQSPDVVGPTFGKVREPVMRFTQWARAFNIRSARAQDETYLRNTSGQDRLAQHPFRSPSVFNFYRPGYVAPGTESGAAGITGPELQLVNESSTIGYVNTMSRFVRDNTPNVSGSSGGAFSPDYTREIRLADDAAALVDHLNTLLMYGQMTQDTRGRMINLLNEIPIRADRQSEDLETRVHLAVLMAVTSHEYNVQK